MSTDKTIADFDGAIQVKNTKNNKAIFFVDEEDTGGNDVFDIGTNGKSFYLHLNRDKIFQVYGTNRLGFNLDVHSDIDKKQSLGLKNYQWKELHVADIYLKNLETPPSEVQTVELVMDPESGKIYRKP